MVVRVKARAISLWSGGCSACCRKWKRFLPLTKSGPVNWARELRGSYKLLRRTYRPGPEGEALPEPDVPGFAPGFEVPGFEPGVEVPGFVEPGFVEPGFVPPFGDAPGLEGDPGVVGLALGLVLGFGFGLFGFVDGWALPFGFDGFAPGSVFGAVEPVGGAVVLPVGGAPVLPVGGVEGDAWPGVAAPPGDPAPPADPAPPPGAACATTHVAQNKITDNNISFFADIVKPPALNLRFPFQCRRTAGLKGSIARV
jgi:hypothetical protein